MTETLGEQGTSVNPARSAVGALECRDCAKGSRCGSEQASPELLNPSNGHIRKCPVPCC